MLYEIAEIIGIISFSISGFLVALRAQLDLLGIFISSFSTALVGGLMRDSIAGVTPYIFTSALPGIIVLATVCLLLFWRKRIARFEKSRFFLIADSIGLISFAFTGALVALQMEFNIFGVVLSAFITAVGGGLSRDVIINEVPFFMKSDFYAVIPIFIGVSLYLLHLTSLLSGGVLVAAFIAFLLLRWCAVYYRWHLPVLALD